MTALKTGADVLGPSDMGGSKRPRLSSETERDESENWTSSSKKQLKQKQQQQLQQLTASGKKAKKAKKEEKGKAVKGKKNKKRDVSDEEAEEEEEEMDEGAMDLIGQMDEDEEDEEITLGQKLELLSKSMNDIVDAREKDIQQVEKQVKRRIPTADSLVTLLEQALQSNDAALLEQCLLCTNLDIIDATTQRLPTQRVLVLLKTLVAKFEKRPSRGLLVTHWLSYILKHHISFLITVPDLSRQLAGLSQLLEQRLISYTRLASLSGRLDLLMSQVTTQKFVNGSDSTHITPLAEYQDE